MDDAVKFIYKQILLYNVRYTKPPLPLEQYNGKIDGISINEIVKLLYYAVK